MSDPKRSLRNVMRRIEQSIDEAIQPQHMIPVAEHAVDLIVKRTRLGYGVDRQFGSKQALKRLSDPYKEFRKRFSGLSDATSPGKSNLTLTGQMLDSVKVIRATKGKIHFGPTGNRSDGLSNMQVAKYQERQGRVFNRISQLEYNQTLRFYRREFGDLLRKRRLIK